MLDSQMLGEVAWHPTHLAKWKERERNKRKTLYFNIDKYSYTHPIMNLCVIFLKIKIVTSNHDFSFKKLYTEVCV